MAGKAGELRTAGDVVLWWLGRVEQKREMYLMAVCWQASSPFAMLYSMG